MGRFQLSLQAVEATQAETGLRPPEQCLGWMVLLLWVSCSAAACTNSVPFGKPGKLGLPTVLTSCLTGYWIGGTIHLVINNQIGFTTVPTDARTSRHCSDVVKVCGSGVQGHISSRSSLVCSQHTHDQHMTAPDWHCLPRIQCAHENLSLQPVPVRACSTASCPEYW